MTKVILSLFAIFLVSFCAPTAIFHDAGNCKNLNHQYFKKGEFIYDNLVTMTLSGDYARGFTVEYQRMAGAVELRLMDEENYDLMKNQETYVWYNIISETDCDTIYVQMQEGARYYVVGICKSDQSCHAGIHLESEMECSVRNKSSCDDALLCGWCEGIDGVEGENFCVKGHAYSPYYNIKCQDYSSYLGHIIYFLIAFLICCCAFCFGCCFLICRKPKANRTLQQQKTALLVHQQPVLLNNQPYHKV
eukprot:TRINITY_DN873_c1_g1_i1.p1 TRINITY_DN873_c1_g1~~TRINITY_DN873_c1_g1_i1.p1  ORF type:complete len:248 (+),score=44.18 TRINITY_DN873_c1_g1_i1:84-827(+)